MKHKYLCTETISKCTAELKYQSC